MKFLNFVLSARYKSLAIISTFAVIVSLLISSCEKSIVEQVAVEKFTVAEVQIKTTAVLPLLIGKDSLIAVSVFPANTTINKLIWTSSNPAIATVTEDGKITAIALGEAKIEAVSTDGSVRKGSIKVQVIDHLEYISGITITSNASNLYEGEELALGAIIAPANATYKTLNWSSSNPMIASVSENGVVTGILKGKAIITAKARYGTGVSNTIELTVKETIPVTSLTFNTVITQPLALNETRTLLVNVLPVQAANQPLIWTSSNPAIVSVINGVVKALGDGSAIITVTSASKASVNLKATMEIYVDGGKISDLFSSTTTSAWRTPTSNATGVVVNDKFQVTMAPGARYRGDFLRTGGAIIHAGKYPIIAFKFNKPLGTGNIIFDTQLGTFLNGNNKLTTIIGKDGVQVHYADLAGGSFGAGPTKLSTTAATTFTTFQLKVADYVLTPAEFAAGGSTYQVHWVKSFSSLTELQVFINQ